MTTSVVSVKSTGTSPHIESRRKSISDSGLSEIDIVGNSRRCRKIDSGWSTTPRGLVSNFYHFYGPGRLKSVWTLKRSLFGNKISRGNRPLPLHFILPSRICGRWFPDVNSIVGRLCIDRVTRTLTSPVPPSLFLMCSHVILFEGKWFRLYCLRRTFPGFKVVIYGYDSESYRIDKNHTQIVRTSISGSVLVIYPYKPKYTYLRVFSITHWYVWPLLWAKVIRVLLPWVTRIRFGVIDLRGLDCLSTWPNDFRVDVVVESPLCRKRSYVTYMMT